MNIWWPQKNNSYKLEPEEKTHCRMKWKLMYVSVGVQCRNLTWPKPSVYRQSRKMRRPRTFLQRAAKKTFEPCFAFGTNVSPERNRLCVHKKKRFGILNSAHRKGNVVAAATKLLSATVLLLAALACKEQGGSSQTKREKKKPEFEFSR